jgi:hypothetical protein
MPRHNERKTAPSLENLETRNLQSALGAGAHVAAVGAVAPTPAMIVLSSGQSQDLSSLHAYHKISGFFGQ